jgi:hypothetical protein
LVVIFPKHLVEFTKPAVLLRSATVDFIR